ncbi:penicillin acylase family protein [Bacillus canaveralius]|uniref:penicillin acylase family protein n=1 Tax=Bacillus canaveralius TaxID=1403243 RepID=UPI001C60BD4A|nr:penicillin acylase family protein [Bacillus canaveralius]
MENPHKAYILTTANNIDIGELQSPNDSNWYEYIESHGFAKYSRIEKLDGTLSNPNVTANGKNAQTLFSFNLIEHVERKYGAIPASTVADKVAWLKANAYFFTFNWHGKGSAPNSTKSKLGYWNAVSNAWATGPSWERSGTTIQRTPIGFENIHIQHLIDANGFAHFIAFAEPSDGVTLSKIETDYVNLEVKLKDSVRMITDLLTGEKRFVI